MSRILVLAGLLIVVCFAAGGAWAQGQALPPGVQIIPPGAGVPAPLAQLSGVWEGVWDYEAPPGTGGYRLYAMDKAGRGVKIAVAKIDPPRVNAMCAMGGSPDKPAKWFWVKDAAVAGNAIVLIWGKSGEQKTLTLRPTGNPGLAQATLEAEKATKPLKATLQKK